MLIWLVIQFVKKSPSIWHHQLIQKNASQFDSNYHFACLKLPRSNCYVNSCEEKFRICFVTKEVKLMRRLEMSFLFIDPDWERVLASLYAWLTACQSKWNNNDKKYRSYFLSLLSITTNGIHFNGCNVKEPWIALRVNARRANFTKPRFEIVNLRSFE